MAEDSVSANEALSALEKMDKVFKSFEHVKKAVKYLSGLEQNIRELEQSVALHQERAAQSQAASHEAIVRATAEQSARLALLDQEWAARRAESEAESRSLHETVERELQEIRAQYEEMRVALAAKTRALEAVQAETGRLRGEAEAFEARVLAARQSAATILQGTDA